MNPELMSAEVTFFFYLAAVLCFLIATVGSIASRIGLVPLGFALFIIPTLYNTWKLAF